MPDPNIPQNVKDRLKETLTDNGAIDRVGDPIGDVIADPLLTELMLLNGGTGSLGTELFSFDGTTLSLVADIEPQAFSGTIPDSSRPGGFTLFDGAVYFSARTAPNGYELWRLNGDGSVEQVADINPGPGHSVPAEFTEVGGVLYFRATGPSGSELYAYDGTTLTLHDINATGGSTPGGLTAVGDTLFFSADDGSLESDGVTPVGRELWTLDGAGNPVLAANINPNGDSSIQWMTALGDTLYFAANDGTNGKELWKAEIDATTGNVTASLVKDLMPGSSSSGPQYLTAVDGKLYFSVTVPNNLGTKNVVYELDPALGQLSEAAAIAAAAGFTGLDGAVYFSGVDTAAGEGRELHRLNADGTVDSFDINTGAGSSNPLNLVAVDGELYFTADNGTDGDELHRLNADGSIDSFDFLAGPDGSDAELYGVVNGVLVVRALLDHDNDATTALVPLMLAADSRPTSVSDFTIVDHDGGSGAEDFFLDPVGNSGGPLVFEPDQLVI